MAASTIISKEACMKAIIFTTVFFLFGTFYSSAQTLNEIIDYHFDAVNQDKFNKTNTIIIDADLATPEGKGKLLIFHKRPNKLRVEETINKKTKTTIFDGAVGAIINGVDTIHLKGQTLEDIKFNADFDGYFFCYREKAHDLKFEGEITDGKNKFFKIVCIQPAGDSTDIFVDSKTYLLEKTIKRKNGKIRETHLYNYKKTDDIPFPYKLTITEDGKTKTQSVKNIKLNVDISDNLFLIK